MSLTKEDLQAIGELIDGKFDNKLEPINKRLDSIENRMDSLEESQQTLMESVQAIKSSQLELEENLQTVKNSQLRVELEQYPRITAALDGVVAGIKKNEVQDERISTLEGKADDHNVRISALEQKAI